MSDKDHSPSKFGQLALAATGQHLHIEVMQSNAGFYLGTYGDFGPCSRESSQYWPTHELAKSALETGNWSQHEYDIPVLRERG